MRVSGGAHQFTCGYREKRADCAELLCGRPFGRMSRLDAVGRGTSLHGGFEGGRGVCPPIREISVELYLGLRLGTFRSIPSCLQ